LNNKRQIVYEWLRERQRAANVQFAKASGCSGQKAENGWED
jgi:hypothetical protein